ncbi:MAG: DUF475 domain-containing protein [Candidatus Pacebacteria bacterium]|nr:DUF475 domain-containing protein [Candidatus Paceibacterota bacterium]
MRLFIFPVLITLAACVGAFFWGGYEALFLVVLLAILETTLSFDNAVINAKILAQMSPLWQRRFLTWGIIFAVFGTRFVLPIIIVAVAVSLSPLAVAKLAFLDPVAYGDHIADAHVAISAFGSAFLMLVSLKYFFNRAKTMHWIEAVEERLSSWGRIEAIELALTLGVLLVCALIVPSEEAATLLIAGIVGVIIFVIMEGVTHSFTTAQVASGGLALFIYLNVLDSAFSLDGVVGAFAVTNSLPVIIAGLGIGALFVRTFTIALVRAKTLTTLVYLEHGAHWAIFGLALAMIAGIFVDVPEVITGLVGFVFVALSYFSSRKARNMLA